MEILVNHESQLLLINFDSIQGLINVIVVNVIEMIFLLFLWDSEGAFDFN